MKIVIAAHHLPHPQGNSAGRQLFAVVEAMRAKGHDATVWSFGTALADLEPPSWCERQPIEAPPRSLRRLPETIRNPRAHIAAAGWQPADDAIVFIDNRDAAPAVPHGRLDVALIHHSVRLDAAATDGWNPGAVQNWRAERRAVTEAKVSAGLSERVRRSVRAERTATPTFPAPAEPLPIVEEPVALLLANWEWAPNAVALTKLLAAWPRVTEAVPHARLVVAGRGSPEVGQIEGVANIGEVDDTTDAMAQAAVLVFPCPSSSGPKMKVLDAMLHGLPVVTTAPGAEGLIADGVTIDDQAGLTDALISLLPDVARRSRNSARARAAAMSVHAPMVAVDSWLKLASAAEALRT